jgi:hypothetical protein
MRIRFLENSILAIAQGMITALEMAWQAFDRVVGRVPRTRKSLTEFMVIKESLRFTQPSESAIQKEQHPNIVGGEEDSSRRLQRTMRLFEQWEAEAGYDLAVWPELKRGIEANRLSDRKRFRDG